LADINPQHSDDHVLAELGARLKRARLDRNIPQAVLAEDAGVSRGTIDRLESGRSVQLTSLLRVLRALKLLENLELLVPPPDTRPLQALRGCRRQRASRTRSEPGEWTWGEP